MCKVDVSVIMCVYNAERFLKDAIESVLNQTLTNFELIIIDDCSTDNSVRIINSFGDTRVVFLQNEKNSGPAAARNKGLKNARADYIAIMDADDISFPDRLKIQLMFLSNNLEYIAIGSFAEAIDMDGKFVYSIKLHIEDYEIKKQMLINIDDKKPNIPFVNPSTMYRKSVALEIGGYNEEYTRAEDVIFFNKMMKKGKFYNFQQPLIQYRILPGSESRVNKKYQDSNYTQVLLKLINEETLSNNEKLSLENMRNKVDKRSLLSNYYAFLSKKYLINNYQPNLARRNAFRAIKSKPECIINWLIVMFSFLPNSLIKKIYS